MDATLRKINMANSFCVMFQRNEIPDALPENKSQAMPAHRPMFGSYMPGGKLKPTAPIRNLPWKSWLGPKKSGHSKRAKRRSSLHGLMGK
jgi:hypothetical protein